MHKINKIFDNNNNNNNNEAIKIKTINQYETDLYFII